MLVLDICSRWRNYPYQNNLRKTLERTSWIRKTLRSLLLSKIIAPWIEGISNLIEVLAYSNATKFSVKTCMCKLPAVWSVDNPMHGMWGIWFLSQVRKMFVPEWFFFTDASQTGSKLVNSLYWRCRTCRQYLYTMKKASIK